MGKRIIDILLDYNKKNKISFAMPGHKNGRGIEDELKQKFFDLDVTELEDTENLHNPKKTLAESLNKMAEYYKADKSFYLVNGSTSGIFTMLMSTCNRGEKVLVDRSCHISVINACITLGIEPVWTNNKAIKELGISDVVSKEDIESILSREKVSAILITSPTYYGLVADVEGISRLAHKYNIPLLVDEAHGVHFGKKVLPKRAIQMGADMSVQSLHKTLNSPNQTGLLHIKRGYVDMKRIIECYSFFQTTSPSYPMVAAMELSWMEDEKNGEANWERVILNADEIRKELKDLAISPDKSWVGKYNFSDIDQSRILVNLSQLKMSGKELAERLNSEYKIDLEMWEENACLFLLSPWNTDEEFKTLKMALGTILKSVEKKNKKESFILPLAEVGITPSEAFYSEGEMVDIKAAENRIAKNSVIPYPPGIPVLMPGERINKDIIKYICRLEEQKKELFGVTKGKINVVKEGEK